MTTKRRRWIDAAMLAATAAAVLASAATASPRPLLPDLTQSTPAKVAIVTVTEGGAPQHQLVFESVVNNVGAGPLIVDGAKSGTGPDVPMVASQAFRLGNGRIRVGAVANVGEIYFDVDHFHWHLRDFERYWLRRTGDNAGVARDGKSGYCLGDRLIAVREYRLPGQSYDPSPLFAEDCWSGHPERNAIREGISVGWGDDYAPQLEGQFIDVTTVPDGRYHLVHTVNQARSLRESDYVNNSASLLIELSRGAPGAAPALRVVARCAFTARCEPRRRPKPLAKPQIENAVAGHRARCRPGSWSPKPRRFYYQWYRYGYILPSARSATYAVKRDDVGKPLSCTVMALGIYGTRTVRSRSVVATG